MDPVLTVVVVIVVLAVVVGLWYIATMNSFRQLEVKVNFLSLSAILKETRRYQFMKRFN